MALILLQVSEYLTSSSLLASVSTVLTFTLLGLEEGIRQRTKLTQVEVHVPTNPTEAQQAHASSELNLQLQHLWPEAREEFYLRE